MNKVWGWVKGWTGSDNGKIVVVAPEEPVAPSLPVTRVKIEHNYQYPGMCSSVHDGDTIRVDVNLGMGIMLLNQSVRLYGIDAPELTGSASAKGKEARALLRDLILDKVVIVSTERDKKDLYGRWIATIWVLDVAGQLVNVNRHLVEKGLAVYKEYGIEES